MSLLQAHDLRLTLATAAGPMPVLHGVDLTIAAGETVGLVGASGSGKTLFAQALIRLEPDGATLAGELSLDGTDLIAADEATLCRVRGRRVGFVFQEPATALDPLTRVLDQVAEPLARHCRLPRPAARAEARTLLARVGLAPPHADPETWPHRLSGGQRQRAMIAVALAGAPDLLIADEPTSALDVLVQRAVLELLASLVAERRMALLLISHDVRVLRRVVGRIAEMRAGRIVRDGPVAEVLG